MRPARGLGLLAFVLLLVAGCGGSSRRNCSPVVLRALPAAGKPVTPAGTPYIDYTNPSLSQGIVGNAQITEPNASTAKDTALILQTGSLPYTFVEAEPGGCAP